MEEDIPRREFRTRRQRSLFSIRRKRDAVWFLITVVPFIVTLTLVVFKVRLRKPVTVNPGAAAPVDR
jgi:hypothetical protein